MPQDIKRTCSDYMNLRKSNRAPYENGRSFAEGLGLEFFETSAKTGKNVIEAFKSLAYIPIR